MSRIYFHSPSGEEEVHGVERGWLDLISSRVGTSYLNLQYARPHYSDFEKWLPYMMPQSRFSGSIPTLPTNIDEIRSFFSYSIINENEIKLPDGDEYHRMSLWSMVLNTAIVLGSDPVRLAARLHGQCEIHAYVLGPNRAWLADIIDQGLELNIFRKHHPANKDYGTGWDKVAEFLRDNDEEEVVTSYSVCDSFPDQTLVKDTEEVLRIKADYVGKHGSLEDWFYDLDDETQWRLAWDSLKQDETLELNPDNWSTYHYGSNWNLITFDNWLNSEAKQEELNVSI